MRSSRFFLIIQDTFMSQQYYVVASTSELEEDGQMYIELNGEEILLCKHRGQYHAIAYYCSHEAFTLEGGTLHNGCITCPYHGAEFALSDGSVQAPPAYEPIKTYPVKVENDTIALTTDIE
jgi:3-phenylpropionate/trans-cinnamate dioxygenase ferredoxin subunit